MKVTRKIFMLKRSIVIAGHKTSICLEPAFWDEFKSIAKRGKMSLSYLASLIDEGKDEDQNLSSAARVYILEDVRLRARLSTERAESLDLQVRMLTTAGEKVVDGMATMSTVIAAGRANG